MRTLRESNVGDITAIPSSTTVVTIAPAKPGRLGCSIFNDSTATLTLAMKAGASASVKSLVMGAGDYFEVPEGYRGIITGLWASVNGNAYVTEYS